MAKLKLHPGVKWIFRIHLLGILIFMSIILVILIGIIYWLVLFVLLLILVEVYARMSYNRWFYEFTPTNLRLERGIIWKRYSNIPYERVQNIDIHRGILARIFGFSSVMIQTAGYSMSHTSYMVEGYIPAVSIKEAEKIREFLISKISKSKKSNQGL